MSRRGGVTLKDVPAAPFIAALATHFKKSAKWELPEWTTIIKTGAFKEMCPQNPDWYYVRAASMARQLYLQGGKGIGGFARMYGGRKRKTTRARHFAPASTGLHRHIVQQLEELKFVEQRKDKKGRWITRDGQKELDVIAGRVVLAEATAARAAAKQKALTETKTEEKKEVAPAPSGGKEKKPQGQKKEKQPKKDKKDS